MEVWPFLSVVRLYDTPLIEMVTTKSDKAFPFSSSKVHSSLVPSLQYIVISLASILSTAISTRASNPIIFAAYSFSSSAIVTLLFLLNPIIITFFKRSRDFTVKNSLTVCIGFCSSNIIFISAEFNFNISDWLVI